MNQDVVSSWLRNKRNWGVVANCSFGFLALIAGILILLLTFWFAYLVVFMIWPGVSALSEITVGRKLHLSHEVRLVCSGVFIVLLFIQHFRTSPWHWGDYPMRDDYTPIAGHALGPAALLRYPGASANMIADILLSGPRLVMGSLKMCQLGMHLRRLDVGGCASLLSYLAAQFKAVPYEELRSAGWEKWLDDLKLIEGVVFLEKGITLSEDLRSELLIRDKS